MHLFKQILISQLAVLCFFAVAELASRIKYTPEKYSFDGMFEYDRNKVFRLKANYRGKSVKTNSFGFRSPEIKTKKDRGVVRIAAIGDSITFGDEVSEDQTYSRNLERMLNEKVKQFRFEVINCGAPGNSPFQEYYDLQRTLIFEPDIVIIQFTLNDVVEPYWFLKRLGGKGIDYHGVRDVSYLHYMLSQHSAFYLFFRDMVLRVQHMCFSHGGIREKAKHREVEDVKNLVVKPDSPAIKEAWLNCLEWMSKEVELCKDKNIGCILLVSPYDFQMIDTCPPSPQLILHDFARVNHIESINLLALLKQEVRRKVAKKIPGGGGLEYDQIVNLYPNDIEGVWRNYFMDENHYNPQGHILVAETLYAMVVDMLRTRNLLD